MHNTNPNRLTGEGGLVADMTALRLDPSAAAELEGAEAAAATFAAVFTVMSAHTPQRFTCDRPFMFLIRDNLTGMILFSGHVTDPSK